MSDWILWTVMTLAMAVFTAKRLLRYLHFFQQEDYQPKRFLHWMMQKRAFDRRGLVLTLVFILLSLVSLVTAVTLTTIAFFFVAWKEEDPRKIGKKPLIFTPRAKRIYFTALTIYLCLQGLSVGLLHAAVIPLSVVQILLFQLTPGFICAAYLLLSVDEKKRQTLFSSNAQKIWSEVNPFTIGITGSYGKTSTKDALARIMQGTLGPTFWPEKGINTPMGNTRAICESLKIGHKYAVVEMGAYGRGSIERLCRLTPPHAAIITVIGSAHLERFGSQENILRTKSELAQMVPQEGILVCNGDNEGTRRIAKENPKKQTFLYGFDASQKDLDCYITQWSTSLEGTDFVLNWQNTAYNGKTKLIGKPALSNILGAFTMACALGANPAYVLANIANLEPVDNRLQLQKRDGIIYLHDAYNSNPTGFTAALEVMSTLPVQRRILMTPGMIELGLLQDLAHIEIGSLAAMICDLVLVIGTHNRAALTQGLLNGGMSQEKIIYCTHRDEAFKMLKTMLQPGDALLIENDLADLHEAKVSF